MYCTVSRVIAHGQDYICPGAGKFSASYSCQFKWRLDVVPTVKPSYTKFCYRREREFSHVSILLFYTQKEVPVISTVCQMALYAHSNSGEK